MSQGIKKKNGTNELIQKTETDSQTQKTNYGLLLLPKGKGVGRDKLGVWDLTGTHLFSC